MKKVASLLIIALTMVSCSVQSNFLGSNQIPQYDIMGAGSGNEGMTLVKVFVYANNNVADSELKRAAVHGVVFRGYTGNNSGASQPAMASPTAEIDYADFCKAFFAPNGQCQSYATIISGSYDRIKTGKSYKYGAIVQVNKSALRKDLEKAGLVRSLSSGF